MKPTALTDKDGSRRWDYAIRFEPWDGEYVITINGRPIGQSLPTREAAHVVSQWLPTAMDEIQGRNSA